MPKSIFRQIVSSSQASPFTVQYVHSTPAQALYVDPQWVLAVVALLDLRELHGWDTSIGAGPIFADEGYHDYYYGVSSAFATASRSAYEGKAGYSGISILIGTRRRFGRLWVGAFLRYDNLAGAAFEDSPLFETEHVFIAGAGIAWVFWQSEESVAAD